MPSGNTSPLFCPPSLGVPIIHAKTTPARYAHTPHTPTPHPCQMPSYYTTWAAITPPIKRIDTSRYIIMHVLGGVYMYADVECVTPLDTLVEPFPLGSAWFGDFPDPFFMLSAPGNRCWLQVGGEHAIACLHGCVFFRCVIRVRASVYVPSLCVIVRVRVWVGLTASIRLQGD